MSMRRSILTPASMVEDPDDIDRLTAMKAYYSEKLDSAIVILVYLSLSYCVFQ